MLDMSARDRLLAQGCLERRCGRLRLNPGFLDVSNTVISTLLAPAGRVIAHLRADMALTERQRLIVNAVTERYIGTGAPVSSKELVNVGRALRLLLHGAQRVRAARGEGVSHPPAHFGRPGRPRIRDTASSWTI